MGLTVGPSIGTNVWASLCLMADMRARGERGSVVTLLCDGGERYESTYYDVAWVEDLGIDIRPYLAALRMYDRTGTFSSEGLPSFGFIPM